MDKQTAIDLLDNLLGMVEDNHDSDYDAALHIGIDALKSNAPNALSALDCVERQAAIEAFEKELSAKYNGHELAIGFVGVESIIRNLPSVQQCDTCRYAGLEWDEEPCDSCTRGGETNHYKPSVQPEHLVKESGNLVKGLVNDCISRKAAIDALAEQIMESALMDNPTTASTDIDRYRPIAELSLRDVPSVQPQQVTGKLNSDCISRKAAIEICNDAINFWDGTSGVTGIWSVRNEIAKLESAHPERMTNRQWVDFLSAQFDISRTSAKEMLHGMMRWKKEDNFKKMFNGGKT